MLNNQVKIFKALSDPNRLRILRILQDRTLCVCEITAVLKLATSTVSNHLSILKNAGFILEEKEGKWVNYKLNSNSLNHIIYNCLSQLPFWLEGDNQLKEDIKLCNSIDRKKICRK